MKITATALRLFLAFMLAVSISWAQTSTAPDDNPTGSELLKTAWAQFDANDYDSALATVNKVIAQNPKSGNAAVLRFLIHNRKEPEGNPTEYSTRIIELAPGNQWVEMAYLSRGSFRLITQKK